MMDMRGLGEAMVHLFIAAIIISAAVGVVLWELGGYIYRHLSWAWN